MLKRSFNPDLSGKTKTFIIFIFLLFLYSFSFALDSLEVVMTFESTSGAFITSFDGADFNNDGFSDLIISNNSERMLQFYFGSADPDPILDLEYEMPYDWGAGQPSYAGDLNGDGWNDLVVPIIILDFQLIYIFFGADTINIDFDNPDILLNSWYYAPDTWGLKWYGKNTGTDFNGDGYDDLIASGEGPEMSYEGQVDIFFGGVEMDTIVDFHIQGEYLNQFGKYNAVGDINGDGYDDLIVSRNIEGDIEPHKYEIYLGGPDMDTVMDYEIPGEFWDEGLFSNGNINDDSYDDLVISGYGIYFGKPDGEITLDVILYYGSFYCNINDDDYSDIVARVNSENAIYIYYGNEDFDTEPDIILQDNINSSFGFVGCNLGDFNGDGKNDIIINNGYPFNTSTVYTLAGGQSVDDNYELPITNYEIISVYPNPFTHNTNISFSIKNSNNIQLDIYNIKGQRIKTLVSELMKVGNHEIEWDGRNDYGKPVANGIYFYKLSTDTKSITKKMILLR